MNFDLLELAEPFGRWCEERGKSRSVALRELVASVVGGAAGAGQVARGRQLLAGAAGRDARAPRRRVSVRLDEVEWTALHEQAAVAGMPAARYVGMMLTAADDGRRVPSKEAVMVLLGSNVRMAGVVRYLSEVGRLLRANPGGATDSEREAIAQALEAARAHVSAVVAVMVDLAPSRRLARWKVPPKVRGGRARGGKQT